MATRKRGGLEAVTVNDPAGSDGSSFVYERFKPKPAGGAIPSALKPDARRFRLFIRISAKYLVLGTAAVVGLVMFAFVLSLPDINRRQGLCRNAQGMGDELRLLFPLGMRAPQPDDLKWQVEAVQPVWDGLWNLLPPLADVEKLMKATPGSEDLRKGALPPQWALRGLRDGLAHFLDSVPEYPTHAFQGRGVVVTGGSIKYWSAAVLTFSSLRKQGCNLPGELWVLGSELSGLPSKVIGILQEELGVSVRVLPQDVYPGGGGYRAKVCAIVSSRFSEVLFMDADNIAVSNPCELFESPEYQQTGAILWQDFWDPSPATALSNITGRENLKNTHESGQMLLNKRMGWKELLTAAYLNFLGPGLYYRFLTDHVGEGDKETFAYSYLLWGRPYHLIGKKVEAVGIRSPEGWIGHGMMQRSPAGFPVFLHANIRKPNFLTLPDRLPLDNKGPKYKTHDAEMTVAAGYNVESFAHQVLRAVRCDKHVAAFTFSSRISKQPAMDTIFSGIKSLYRKCKLSRTTDENREYMTGVTVIDPLLAWPLC